MSSNVVFGGAQIGGLYRRVDEATASLALETAWQLGIRSFDTAPHYGAGLSERRLGRFLRQFPRQDYRLSTKVGRLLEPTHMDTEGAEDFFGGDQMVRVRDYSGDGVIRSLEDSAERMGLETFDTVYVHDPEDHIDQAATEAIPALKSARDRFAIGAVGVGTNHVRPLLNILNKADVDAVMLAGRLTLLDRTAEHELAPLCTTRGIAIVAAGVFNSGLLANPRPEAKYDYQGAPPELVSRALAIKAACDRRGVPIRAVAQQFPLRVPPVAAVAVGLRTAAQVAEAVANEQEVIDEATWAELLVVAR